MVQMSSPYRNPQTGIYAFYRAVPDRLQAEIGKTQVRWSLKTRDPAEAKRRYAFEQARFETMLAEAEARIVARQAADEISPERAAAIVTRWLGIQTGTSSFSRWPTLALTWWLEDTADRLFGIGGVGSAPPVGDDDPAERLLALRGCSLVGDHWLACVRERPRSDWMQATRMVLDRLFEFAEPPVKRVPANEGTLMDAWNVRVVEDNARFHADVDAPRRAGAKPRGRPDLRFRELLKLWGEEKKPRPQTFAEAENAVEDMISYLGDVAVAALTSDMLMDYRDEAKRLPASMPRADRALPFDQRVARHGSTCTPRVSPTTLKKRVGAVQALLSFAHQERWIEHNVGTGVRITGFTRGGRGRRSFHDGELAQLFASDLFLRPDLLLRRRTAVSDVTLYWLFVLGLTSGARLEEVGQARVRDVKKDGGILYVDVDDVASEPAGSVLPGKSIKTSGSRRVIPVHDRALALGFESYVDALRMAGQELLFPDLRPNSLGKLTQEASRRLNRHIDAVVDTDDRLVFHSLRHRFKDAGREAEVQERVLDQLCGHVPATVGGRYGDGAGLASLKRSLDRITFDSVDWSRMTNAAKLIDWRSVARDLIGRSPTSRAGKA